MYWNITKAKSFNCLFNIVLGERGSGKTFRCKKEAIDQFLKTGEEFVYLRRYNTGMGLAKPKFFDDIMEFYPNLIFSVDGNVGKINDVVACHFIVLSQASLYKSTPFPNVMTIIFDEFLIADDFHRYLKDEVNMFLNLYETINRTLSREKKNKEHCVVWMLANCLSVTNPYFLQFDIELPNNKNKIRRVNKEILIEIVEDLENQEIISKSRVAVATQGTDFYSHSYENNFYLDNEDFIRPLPKDKHYLFTLKVSGKSFGVWRDRELGNYHVSVKYDKDYKLSYTTILEDHSVNTTLVRNNSKQYYLFNSMTKQFKRGCLFYDDINTKNIVLKSMKGIMR